MKSFGSKCDRFCSTLWEWSAKNGNRNDGNCENYFKRIKCKIKWGEKESIAKALDFHVFRLFSILLSFPVFPHFSAHIFKSVDFHEKNTGSAENDREAYKIERDR